MLVVRMAKEVRTKGVRMAKGVKVRVAKGVRMAKEKAMFVMRTAKRGIAKVTEIKAWVAKRTAAKVGRRMDHGVDKSHHRKGHRSDLGTDHGVITIAKAGSALLSKLLEHIYHWIIVLGLCLELEFEGL